MSIEAGHIPGRAFIGQDGILYKNRSDLQVASADGAITVQDGTVVVTKGSAAALTLAAPTATDDDGKVLRIMSTTAFAHTVTNTSPGFQNAGASKDVATFGAAVGNSFEVIAYNGAWYVLSTPVGVTLA